VLMLSGDWLAIPSTLLGIQVRLDGSDDACCDLVLDCKHIVKLPWPAPCG
jgi:hypothetical protein